MLFMEIPTYRRLNIQAEYGMSRTYKLTMNKVEQFKWNLMEQERSEATIEKYIRDINAFFEWLPEGKRVDKPVTIAYKQSLLERGYASSSINSMVAALNSFFSYSEWGDCRIRPLRIQAQTMVSEERKLTKEEYKRLLHAAKEKNERLYLVMQSICSVGLRVSELKFLTVEAVHRGRTVVNNKGKMRTVVLPPKLCLILKQYCRRQRVTGGSIFVSRTGRPLDRSNIWSAMKELAKAAGVAADKVFPHNLRHLFASVYYERFQDIVKLADILGHSNVNTTRIYTTATAAQYQAQIAVLGLLNP